MRNSKSEPNLKHSLQSKRLPCRGCTADCKNYALKENPINLYDLLGSR